jgi:hypothetical protein
MIEICFKCDGQGEITKWTNEYMSPDKDNPHIQNFCRDEVRTRCNRCLGAGAVDYQFLKAVPVIENIEREAKRSKRVPRSEGSPTPPLKSPTTPR